MVCDAGGGTAVSLNGPLLMNGPTNSLQDLITYKVKSVNPWKIEECVQGDGKPSDTLSCFCADLK